MNKSTDIVLSIESNLPRDIRIDFRGFEHKTTNEVIEEFLSYKNSEQTKRAYRVDIKTFFTRHNINFIKEIGKIEYHEIVRLLLSYINSFKKSEKYHPDRIINTKTINRKAYSLSAFFKFLVNVYNYPKNPIENFIPLKVKKNSTTTSLNRDEMFEVMNYLKLNSDKSTRSLRDYLIFMCMFYLALRRSEAANLKWVDLNHDRCSVTVYQKGGTYKELPLPDHLYTLLLDFKRSDKIKSDYIFHPVVNNRTQIINKPVSPDLIFKIVKKVITKILPEKNITPHSFRKTFIEFALNNKQDFISIINATGHTNIEMVRYYDTRDKLKNNAINNMSF